MDTDESDCGIRGMVMNETILVVVDPRDYGTVLAVEVLEWMQIFYEGMEWDGTEKSS